MKAIIVVTLLMVLAGCSSAPTRTDVVASPPVSTVTGWVQKSVLLGDETGHPGFRAEYEAATVDENLAGMIRSLMVGVDVLVFYGPWCGDSRRQVPVFVKIVEKAGIPGGQIRYYAVDRSKRSRDGLTGQYGIEKVPTFIFLREGKEIGRVVESPTTTLEGDIVSILAAARAE
jgi:thiol-disulfide isomerase/thioredoxin